MPQITTKVLYINDAKPGQRSGNIKLENGWYINVMPDDLGRFRKGGTYAIEFKERNYQGRTYRDLVSATSAGHGDAQNSTPAKPNGAGYTPKSGHDYETGKQICVTGITQRAVQAGASIQDIPTIMRMVAAEYDSIFSKKDTLEPRPQTPSSVTVRGQTYVRTTEPPPFDDPHGLDDGGEYNPEPPPY